MPEVSPGLVERLVGAVAIGDGVLRVEAGVVERAPGRLNGVCGGAGGGRHGAVTRLQEAARDVAGERDVGGPAGRGRRGLH